MTDEPTVPQVPQETESSASPSTEDESRPTSSTHRGRGGARPGAGRPPVEGKRLECLVPVRMSTRQKSAFRTLGGSRWLRETLNAAIAADFSLLPTPIPSSLPEALSGASSAVFLPEDAVRIESARWGALLSGPDSLPAHGEQPEALFSERFFALRVPAQLLAGNGRSEPLGTTGEEPADSHDVRMIVETQGDDVRAAKNLLAGSGTTVPKKPSEQPFVARTTTGYLVASSADLLEAGKSQALQILGCVRALCAMRLL